MHILWYTNASYYKWVDITYGIVFMRYSSNQRRCYSNPARMFFIVTYRLHIDVWRYHFSRFTLNTSIVLPRQLFLPVTSLLTRFFRLINKIVYKKERSFGFLSLLYLSLFFISSRDRTAGRLLFVRSAPFPPSRPARQANHVLSIYSVSCESTTVAQWGPFFALLYLSSLRFFYLGKLE